MADTVSNLMGHEGIAFQCQCRTHTFNKSELVNAFGADTPLENIGLRYRCSQCDLPAQRAWIAQPRVLRQLHEPR